MKYLTIIPPERGYDSQGAGHFGASRGSRTHIGIDMACMKGSQVLSCTDGKVTKIGYPYNPSDEKKGHLRYVQITTDGHDLRYFYIKPMVELGQEIKEGDILGLVQGLADIYDGITEHFHFEVKKNGEVINPNNYLEDL